MNVLRRASSSSAASSLRASTVPSQLSLTRTFTTSPSIFSRTNKEKAAIARGIQPKLIPDPFDPADRQPASWRTSELTEAEEAKVSSTPHNVRERRAMRGIPGDVKMSEDGVSIHERLEYEKRRARGDFLDTHDWPNGEPTAREWLDHVNARRSRVRGTRTVQKVRVDENGVQTKVDVETVVGRPVYLPDLVMRLIPNHTPADQPYNPYEATFYLNDHGVTKHDIRSYLKAVYGLDVTYIRTDNYYAPIQHRPGLQTKRYNKGISLKSRKRAVVGLHEPFFFPNMLEDMTTKEKEDYIANIDEAVAMTTQLEDQKRFLRQQMGLDPDPWTNRVMGKKNILKDRQERRKEAEEGVKSAVKDMIEKATEGSLVIKPEQIVLPESK